MVRGGRRAPKGPNGPNSNGNYLGLRPEPSPARRGSGHVSRPVKVSNGKWQRRREHPRPPSTVSAPFPKMILLPEASSAPNLLLVARSPGMGGFRKQRTASGAGYGRPGFPRANTTALNPILPAAIASARVTGRDTWPDPRRAGEAASLAAAFPSRALTGRDTSRRWAPAWGRLRPKAARLVVAVGSRQGPARLPPRPLLPRFPIAAHRRRSEAGQGGPPGAKRGRTTLTRAAETATIKRRETGEPEEPHTTKGAWRQPTGTRVACPPSSGDKEPRCWGLLLDMPRWAQPGDLGSGVGVGFGDSGSGGRPGHRHHDQQAQGGAAEQQ